MLLLVDSVIFRLLDSVNLLESLLDHPQVLGVLHIKLGVFEHRKQPVSFLENFRVLFSHVLIDRLTAGVCSSRTLEVTEGQDRLGFVEVGRLLHGDQLLI